MNTQNLATQFYDRMSAILWQYASAASACSKADLIHHIENAVVLIDDLVYSYRRSFEMLFNQIITSFSPQYLNVFRAYYNELKENLEQLHEKIHSQATLDETTRQFLAYLLNVSGIFILQKNVIVNLAKSAAVDEQLRKLTTYVL